MRSYRIVSMGVIMIAAVTVTSFQASARSGGGMGGGSSMSQMSRVPSGGAVGRSAPVYRGTAVVRDHRATAEKKVIRTEKKVIRAGRLYDKSPNRVQVIVNGKRVPRKI